MSAKIVTITGGSGFVGQILRPGLAAHGYEIRVFDRVRGRLVDAVRRRHLGTAQGGPVLAASRAIHRAQRSLEPRLIGAGLVRPTWDDILDVRSRLALRFRGSHAVIHLAGIPHPYAPGTVDDDFRRINYEGSLNVYHAARDAGVAKFVFASSAQVYAINFLERIEQFPILETNSCPGEGERQTAYGHLKRQVELYLERAATEGGVTQCVSLRLEFPGFRSSTPDNHYVSTSVENLVAGFVCALEAPPDFSFDVFNLCDARVDPGLVSIQRYLRERWPDVPNLTIGNESLLSVQKAQSVLGYRPIKAGTYYHPSLVW